MLGLRRRHTAVPFFWSKHYDLSIRYVGHAQQWDEIEVDGSVERRDCVARFRKSGRTLAVATIGRDREALHAEAAMEKETVPAG
jgi:hypothetical protein